MIRTGNIGRNTALTVNKGFTLLEVLIALVLFSFILSMVYSSLYATGRNWRASESQIQDNDDRRLILSFIRIRIEQLTPIIQADTGGNYRVVFRGGDSSVQFVSGLPMRQTGSGLFFMKFELQQDELILKYLPLTRDKTMFKEDIFIDADEISLLKNIKEIDLDYFGHDDSESVPAWHDNWHVKERLPILMRFRIVTDSRTPWPELVIAIRSRVDAAQTQLAVYPEENNFNG